MPLYAELQIGAELIIYPLPIPRGKEHYKVNRVLEGGTVEVNGIAPLHLFNGELIYAKETGRTQRVEFNVRPNDTAAKEKAERTMNQLVETMRKDVGEDQLKIYESGTYVISDDKPESKEVAWFEEATEIPKDFIPSKFLSPSSFDTLGMPVIKIKWTEQGAEIVSPLDDQPDTETCRHKHTDYFIGTGIVCRDCKKKLRV